MIIGDWVFDAREKMDDNDVNDDDDVNDVQ